jgi:hypothetical protein
LAIEGSLDLFRLPEILQLIAQQRKTGILTVQGQSDIIAISFLQGRIVAADALNQTLEEGLAKVLVGEGMLAAQEMTRAQSEHLAHGGRLLDVLVEQRYLRREKLLEALRVQTSRLIGRLLRWDQGDFKFYSGDEVSYEEGFEPISIEELLLHSLEDEPAVAAPSPVPPPVPLPRPAAVAAPSPARAVPAASPVTAPAPAVAAPPPPAPRVAAVPAPAPLPPAFRRMKIEQAPVAAPLQRTARWLALVPAALLLWWVIQLPARLLLPFPWQEEQRTALAHEQRTALYLKVDRAAKTYFLMKGHFPESLGTLPGLGLLSGQDLRDPLRRSLAYSVSEEGYTVKPVGEDRQPISGEGFGETITGNFSLDPELLSPGTDSGVPLVLLD